MAFIPDRGRLMRKRAGQHWSCLSCYNDTVVYDNLQVLMAANPIPGMMATLASYEGMFGPYHAQTLALTTTLGIALHASGQSMVARQLLQRAILDLAKHHGRRHPIRIRALDALATLLREQGEWTAALPIQQELMECSPECLAARRDLSTTLSELVAPPIS